MDVAIVGGGIGGLTLALCLHEAGIACRVYEAVPELKALGVGINIRPHAMQVLGRFGIPQEMLKVGNEPHESVFYSSSGQLIYKHPLSRTAGYDVPHISIHRGDLHAILVAKVRERLGPQALCLGHRLTGFTQDDTGVDLHFADSASGAVLPPVHASVLVGSDGINSAVRKQLYPEEGLPRFGGINMWRGVTRRAPFLDGKSICRVGALQTGKIVIYPIRNFSDGTQLINWVVEIVMDVNTQNDWATPGHLADFIERFAHWHFDWLDIPQMFEQAEMILEYPMVDRDPLPRWSFGRVTLLGDAAHPMYPRGGNGAAQSILDANVLPGFLREHADPVAALQAYDAARVPFTTRVVNAARNEPPDTIINRVEEITGGKPFARIEDVIDPQELAAIAQRYAKLTGYDIETVNRIQAEQVRGASRPA